MAVSKIKSALEKINTGAGRCTLQRTYFFTSSKSQSRRGEVCRSRTNRNRIVHMNSPANKMPIAMSTPSCVKPGEPLRTSARKPTAVVSAPKKTANQQDGSEQRRDDIVTHA